MTDERIELTAVATAGVSRRTMLKRSAVVGGGLLWATPIVQTIGTPAFAQGSEPAGTGSVSGTVINASTLAPISGATVTVDGTGQSGTTDANGDYVILGVPAGPQNLTASAPGYSNATAPVVVPTGSNIVQDFNLSELGSVRVVLAWGQNPRDLDLHMSGPDGEGGRFHVYYNDAEPVDHASLDVDDFDEGEGPETITVTVSPSAGGSFVPGNYRTWVHNYSHTNYPSGSTGEGADFSASGATVRVFDTASERTVQAVSDASGAQTDDIWKVATFDLDAAGTMTNLVIVQTLVPGNESFTF